MNTCVPQLVERQRQGASSSYMRVFAGTMLVLPATLDAFRGLLAEPDLSFARRENYTSSLLEVNSHPAWRSARAVTRSPLADVALLAASAWSKGG